MNTEDQVKSGILNSFNTLYEDVDFFIKTAGTKDEFIKFREKSNEFYKNYVKNPDLNSEVPEWESTLILSNKYLFAAALFYLIVKYDFSQAYIDKVLIEEISNADQIQNEGNDYRFVLQFYKYEDESISFEVTTISTEKSNKE